MKNPIALLTLSMLVPVTASALPKAPFPDPLPFPDILDPQPPPPPPPGGGELPPLYVSSPSTGDRTTSSVAVSWHNSSAALAGLALERAASEDGPYATVQCWQPMNMSMDFGKVAGAASTGDCINAAHPGSFVDSGRSADALQCYRIRVWDAAGTQMTSLPSCAFTRAREPDERVAPWQARLMIETGDVGGAGTDDFIRIGLNDHMSNIQPHGDATWLDYPHDDFEAGSAFTYDLNLIEDFDDITKLSVYKDGTDDWCVSRMMLVVDRDTVVEQDFTDLPDGCRWLAGKDNLFEISHDELRAMDSWREFASLPPGFSIENSALVSIVEGAVGHIGYSTELYWNGDDDGAVIDPVDADTLHVDIQASASVEDWFDPTVRIEFDADIVVTCEPNKALGMFDVTLALLPTDPRVDAEGWTAELGEFLACTFEWDWNCLEEELADTVAANLPEFPSGSLQLSSCPDVHVDEFGSIIFSLG